MTTASDLFAISHGSQNVGLEQCHFCGQPCTRLWTYYPAPRVVGVRSNSTARCPSSCFLCNGCSMWRAPRRTVRFLSANGQAAFKDSQCAMRHSWLVVAGQAHVLNLPALAASPDDSIIYKWLLKPCPQFFLAIIEGKCDNLLHLACVNNLYEIKGNTQLHFTLNNIPLTYSPYELQDGMKRGPDGKSPGVQALLRLFGQPKPPPPAAKKKKGEREFAENESIKEMIVASGQYAKV